MGLFNFKKPMPQVLLESEEYKKLLEKFQGISRRIDSVEIDLNLLSGRLKKATTQKAIIQKEIEETEKPKPFSNLKYY